MPYLDLDFKEKTFNIFTYFLLFLLIITLLLCTYFNVRLRKAKEVAIKEGKLLLNTQVIPKGFVRMGNKEKAFLVINKRAYILNSRDTIVLNGVKFSIHVSDTVLTLETGHYIRRIRW